MNNNIKNALKAGVFFGVSMGIFFGIVNSITVGIVFGLIWGSISAILTGFAFGLLMFVFVHLQAKKFKDIKQKMSQTENIIFDDGANHFVGKEAVGGWLFLTEKVLKFVSHKYNIQNHVIEIPINDIKAVFITKTLKLIRNGLIVETLNDKKERFVVNSPDLWIKHINLIRESVNKGPSS